MGDYRVLIVEDEPLVQIAYQRVFEDIQRETPLNTFRISTIDVYEDARALITASVATGKLFDFAILDMRLPSRTKGISEYGQKLGQLFREVSAKTKLLVLTSLLNNHIFYNIITNMNPEGFMVKTEIDPERLKLDVLLMLQGKFIYSKSVVAFLRNEASNNLPIDAIDREILFYLSQGVPVKELPKQVPLSISGIERRKRRLVMLLEPKTASVASLLAAAKERGLV